MITENIIDKVKLISELKEIHSELFQVYKRLFDFKYKHDEEFKVFIDTEYKENGVGSKDKKAWNDNFCHRASYTLLNKILFVRICEDKGFMRNSEDYIAGEVKDPHIGEKLSKTGVQKWNKLVTNYTFGELIKFAFKDMKKSYSNISLYKEDKYEILNPRDEEFSLKYIDGDNDTKNLVLDFENVLNNIIDKLDTNNFNFKYTDGNILGDVYEKFMDRDTRKAIGQFYTPEFVIKYILKNTVEEADVVENPFVTVADISCGSGHFLIMAYDILKEKFLSNLEELKEKYANEIYTMKKSGKEIQLTGKEYWVKENIHYHILKHCIYGADIDSFAVQLTTINLLLKDLDNFTDEINIIECDSLIKWEEDYDWKNLREQLEGEFETITILQANLFGEEEKLKKTVRRERYKLKYTDTFGIQKEEVINREKAEEIINICEFWSKRFNFIVGNPPYVRQEKITNKSYLRDKYNVFSSRADLLIYFIERALNKINIHGLLGIIVSDKFTRANYGGGVRKLIIDKYQLRIFKEKYVEKNNIFEDACVDTATLIIFNEKPNEDSKILFNDSECYLQQKFKDNVWSFSEDLGFTIKGKIENKGIKIKNIDSINLNYGFKTGFNKAFIIDSKTKEEICKNDPKSIEVIKPLLRGRDINKYEVQWQGLWIIVSKFGFHKEIDKYPEIKKHLYMYEKELKERGQCKYSRNPNSDIKKEYDGQHHWLELDNNPNDEYIELFEKDKIIYAEMSIENQFYFDNEKFYSNDTTFIMTAKNISLKYLSGILNSKLILFYFRLISSKLGENGRRYKKIFINEIPLIISSKYQDEIEKNVEVLRKHEPRLKDITIVDYIKNELELSELIVEKKEAQKKIDMLVFKMYEITPQEIDFIEETLNQSDININEYILDEDNENKIEKIELEKKLRQQLTLDNFIQEVHIKGKTLEDLVMEYECDLKSINNLRREYLKLIPVEQRYKLFNMKKLYEHINDYLRNFIYHNIYVAKKVYMGIDKIMDEFKFAKFDFENFIEIIRIGKETLKSKDIISKALSSDVYTWNAYRKDKAKGKVKKTFVKYYDNNYYGLTEWSDEIHKQYFMDAIEEYTVKNPNEKKASDILKLFTDLDIEDKEDYVDIIEDKIKRAFS